MSYLSTRESRAEEAARVLAEHKPVLLADTEKAEVWRFQKPGTSVYGFDICITGFGIAVMGDIDGLVFRVGRDYGLGFLAGDDVEYYTHSKLEEVCKKTEVNNDGLIHCAMEHAHDTWLCEYSGDELVSDVYPNEEELIEYLEHGTAVSDGVDLGEVVRRTVVLTRALQSKWLSAGRSQTSEFGCILAFNEYFGCRTTLDSMGWETGEEAYEFLSEIMEDAWELPYSRPADELLWRLHLVNYAAKKIIAVKNQKEAV